MRDPKRNRSNLQSSLLNAAQVRLNVINRFKTAPIASSCSFKTAMWRFPDHRGWKCMRVKQVDSLNEQRERIRYLRRKEEGRGVRSSNVFPAAPILSLPPRGFLSFLRPIDYPRYYLLSRLSTVSLRTCGLSLSRERKWRISDASKDRTRRHHRRGIINRPRPPGTWIFAFFFFFYAFLFPLLDRIQEEMERGR